MNSQSMFSEGGVSSNKKEKKRRLALAALHSLT
jgi:hypothetical protein